MGKTLEQEKKDKLAHDLQYVKGVGPQRFRLLGRLGVQTIEELLHYYPRRYEDRSQRVEISQAPDEEKCLIVGTVESVRLIRVRRGPSILRVAVSDGTGECHGMWFNSQYLEKAFASGEEISFYGKAHRKGKVLQMSHPEYERIREPDGRRVHTRRIVPIYSLTQDLTQRSLRNLQYQLLVDVLPDVEDPLPTGVRKHHELENRRFCLKEIHFPSSVENLDKAYQRLVFDEFLATQIALFVKKRSAQTQSAAYRDKAVSFNEFKALLPFEPTDDQKKVSEEIAEDLKAGCPMRRLLQGEVGSGKTTVAAFALWATTEAGFQGAIMVPTEILAQQHYFTLSRLLSPAGISVGLLTQGQSEEERTKTLEDLKEGSCQIVVGTHALIQDRVQFQNLKMVVIDEQHKFGVFQRQFLEKKGVKTHVLVMTATPIPQTLTMTLYGDMDLSVMNERPSGRGQIKTVWFSGEKRPAVYDFIQKELEKKKQAYVVYPAVHSLEKSRLQAATTAVTKLRRAFRNARVEVLHGQMKPEVKKAVMTAFSKNEIQVLVATTVIEVGIDVPNASVMVIENAEQFGLSQLHQLRGRIGRGKHDSTCVLISDAESSIAQERLQVFSQLESGFDVAEEDLKLRGPGDLVGHRQHGIPQLRIGDLIRDVSILEKARREAFRIVEEDPKLVSLTYRGLKREIQGRFGDRVF